MMMWQPAKGVKYIIPITFPCCSPSHFERNSTAWRLFASSVFSEARSVSSGFGISIGGSFPGHYAEVSLWHRHIAVGAGPAIPGFLLGACFTSLISTVPQPSAVAGASRMFLRAVAMGCIERVRYSCTGCVASWSSTRVVSLALTDCGSRPLRSCSHRSRRPFGSENSVAKAAGAEVLALSGFYAPGRKLWDTTPQARRRATLID
jgi:hypothetical protein